MPTSRSKEHGAGRGRRRSPRIAPTSGVQRRVQKSAFTFSLRTADAIAMIGFAGKLGIRSGKNNIGRDGAEPLLVHDTTRTNQLATTPRKSTTKTIITKAVRHVGLDVCDGGDCVSATDLCEWLAAAAPSEPLPPATDLEQPARRVGETRHTARLGQAARRFRPALSARRRGATTGGASCRRLRRLGHCSSASRAVPGGRPSADRPGGPLSFCIQLVPLKIASGFHNDSPPHLPVSAATR
jgi:hypothetical protein